MAIYHLSARDPIARSAGRSATAAAAYRACCSITDDRTGEVFDFHRKRGLRMASLLLPGGQQADRSTFWNSVEKHHRRGDAQVGRELITALPAELTDAQRQALATEFSREVVDRFGVAVDLCVHAPSGREDKNHHAHILMSACAVSADGSLGKKVPELDPIWCRRNHTPTLVEWARPRWAELCNQALERSGHDARIDHRSNAERGIEDLPTVKVGHAPGAGRRMTRNHQIRTNNKMLAEARREREELIFQQEKLKMREENAAKIRAAIDANIKPGASLEELAQALQPEGVEGVGVEAATLIFTASGERLDAATLGPQYSLARMVERGLQVPSKSDPLAELLKPEPEPKPEPVDKDAQEQLVSSLELLVEMMASMAHALQKIIARLVNAVLERCGIKHRVQVYEGVVPRLSRAPAPASAPATDKPPRLELATRQIQRIGQVFVGNDAEGWNDLVSKVPATVLSAQQRKDGADWIAHRKLLESEDMAAIKIRVDALPVLRGHGPKDERYSLFSMWERQLRQRLAQLQEQQRLAQKKNDFQSLLNRPSSQEGDQHHQHHRG